MATFTWTPDFGAKKQQKPTVSTIKFGDGYEQRVAHGINTKPAVWQLSFTNRVVDDIDDIDEFLNARGGTEAFDWTPPRAAAAIKVKCEEWERSIDFANNDTLIAVFSEVFEP